MTISVGGGGGGIAIMEIPRKELRFMTNGYIEAVVRKYFNLGQNRNTIEVLRVRMF